MIRVILNGTLRYSDSGGKYEGVDYPTGVEKLSVKYTADPIMRVSNGSFEVNPYQEGNESGDRVIDIQLERELDCEIYRDAVLIFSGKAVRNKRAKMFSYQLKTIAKTIDLLQEDAYGPVPKIFGAVKHITPQLIDQASQVYRVGGKVINAYDNGQSIATTIYKAGDTVFGKTYGYEVFVPQYKILGTITVDAVEGEYDVSQTINIADTATANTNKTFYQGSTTDGVPVSENINDYWIDTDDNNRTYVAQKVGAAAIATGQWELASDERVESGLDDDGFVKQAIVGGKFISGAAQDGLNLTQDYMGYYSGTWDSYIQKEGNFYFGDGGATLGANNFLAYYNQTNGIGGGGDPDTFVISTQQFQVDASGNATFAGDLSAATGTFSGIQVTTNGDNSTATRLSIQGAYISSQASVDDTHRLDYELTEDGQTHMYAYDYNSNYPNEWYEVAVLGASSIAGDISGDVSGWFKTTGTSSSEIACYGYSPGLGDGVVGFTDSGRGVRGYALGTGDGVNAYSVDGLAIDAESYSELSVGAHISKPAGGVAIHGQSNRVFSGPAYTLRGIGVQGEGYMGSVKLTPVASLPNASSWDATKKAEAEGCLHYNSYNGKVYVFNGTSWVALN